MEEDKAANQRSAFSLSFTLALYISNQFGLNKKNFQMEIKIGTSNWKPFPSSFSRVSISFNLEPSWTKSWNRLTDQLFGPCIPGPTVNNGQQGDITEQNSGVYFWGTRIIRPGWSGFYENASGQVMVFLTIFWSKILRNDSAQILDLLISVKMLFEHAPVDNFLLNVLRIFDFFEVKCIFG